MTTTSHRATSIFRSRRLVIAAIAGLAVLGVVLAIMLSGGRSTAESHYLADARNAYMTVSDSTLLSWGHEVCDDLRTDHMLGISSGPEVSIFAVHHNLDEMTAISIEVAARFNLCPDMKDA